MNELQTPTAERPELVIELFAELLGEGRVEEALALYEENAAFMAEPGTLVAGRERIREALERFAALRPVLTGTIEKVVTAGDTALVVNAWTLEGTGPDGEPISMAARSSDVLRRRPNGDWGILIDDPWGGG